MDIQTSVIELIDNLFMEDISDMMDEDLFDAGVLDSMRTVELVIELESKFNIKIPVSDMGRDDWNTGNKIVQGVKDLQNA
jgi:D-alanine--poly(phosphoribitol) ligase subunit 2